MVVVAEPGILDAWGAATLLGEAMGLQSYNVGDLCRAAVQDDTAWGRRFAAYLRGGNLVPDEVVAEFVRDNLDRSSGCWVLFGYPRSVRQAELLAEHGHAPDVVLQIVVDEDRIAQDPRLAWQREQLPQTLAEHRLRTAPLRAFYRDSAAFRPLRQSTPVERLAADLQAMT